MIIIKGRGGCFRITTSGCC